MEYFYETLCPMQWLTYLTLEKLHNQLEPPIETVTRNQLLTSQQSIYTSLFETTRSISPILAEEKPSLIKAKKQRKCFCFGCKRKTKDIEFLYSFVKY